MKSSEFLSEAHLTDPKDQPKSAAKMKPKHRPPRMFEDEQLTELDWKKAAATGALAAATAFGGVPSTAHAQSADQRAEMMANLKHSRNKALGVTPAAGDPYYVDAATANRIDKERGNNSLQRSNTRISPEERQAIHDKSYKDFQDKMGKESSDMRQQQASLAKAQDIAKSFESKFNTFWKSIPEKDSRIKPGYGRTSMIVYYNQQGQYVKHDVITDGSDDMGNVSRYGKKSFNMNTAIVRPDVLAQTRLPSMSDDIFNSVATPSGTVAVQIECGSLGCRAEFSNH